MAYTQLGPFTNNSTSPPINAAFLNGLETALKAVDATALNRPLWAKDAGAKGDGSTDDTAALNAALATGRDVLLNPGGIYPISSGLTNTAGNSLIGSSFNTSVIKATSSMATMYTAKQLAGMTLANVTFQCNGLAQTAIDTSWVVSGVAPSVNNTYSNVRINGYTNLGWKAGGNNDCYFENVLIDQSGNNVALDLQASGGAVTLHMCRINNPINIACQNGIIVGGYYRGIRVFGADYNLIAIYGSYLYADPGNNFNFYINSGATTKAGFRVSGTHIENPYSFASIIGGTGTMWGYSKFESCQFEAPGASNVTMVGPGLASSAAPAAVMVEYGLTDGVGLSSASSGIAVKAINVNNGGSSYLNI